MKARFPTTTQQDSQGVTPGTGGRTDAGPGAPRSRPAAVGGWSIEHGICGDSLPGDTEDRVLRLLASLLARHLTRPVSDQGLPGGTLPAGGGESGERGGASSVEPPFGKGGG